MYEIIKSMVEQAEREENYDLINYVKDLIDKFSYTINCPSNWREIGSKLREKYDCSTWVHEELELWNHKD